MGALGIDWNAGQNFNPTGPRGALDSMTAGVGTGLELGQKLAQAHALQGIDLNSAKSVDAGIGNLVRANAAEQANALQNLAFTRALRQQIPDLMGSLTGTAPSGDPNSTPTAEPDPQHIIETFSLGKQAADQLLATPPADRQSVFAKIKKDLTDRGVPEAAIDSAGSDLSDQALQGLSQHYGELLAHAQHQVSPQPGATPPTMPGAHPASTWYQKVADDPKVAMAVSLMKSAGVDFTPYLEQARALAQPGIAKAAELQYAGPIAATNAGVEVAKQSALVPVEAAKSAAVEAAKLPYDVARTKASADIAAGHDFIAIPEIGSDGQPTGKVLTYRKDQAIDMAGKGGPVGGVRAPEDQAGKTADANLFMKQYEAEGNAGAIRADINARDTALASARMAQSLNPSNLTEWVAKNTNTLNGLGIHIAAGEANKLATYQNLLAQNLKAGIAVFPRNEVEFHAIAGALPTMKTPGDAAALTLTTLAAVKDAQAQEKQFRIDWAAQHPGGYSETAFQKAWNQNPIATQSVFASPLFHDLKVNGRPAVAVAPPIPDGPYKGQVWGIFLPGTDQKMKFRVR